MSARRLVAVLGLVAASSAVAGCRSSSGPADPTERRVSAVTALGHTGWVVSTCTTGCGGTLANAIDGNPATVWTTTGNQATTQFFQVDLGSAQIFTGVTFDARASANNYPRSYSVGVSAASATGPFTAVATGTGTTALINTNFAVQNARYIRVSLTGAFAGPWSIAELNVFSSVLPRTGWVAEASSTSPTADTPAKALDGSLTSRWNTTTIGGQSFTVDLLTPQSFNQITVDSATSNNFIRGYKVEVSNDKVSWGTSVATGTGTGNFLVVTFPYQWARYVRVTETGTQQQQMTAWSVYEFNVFGQVTGLVELSQAGWVGTGSPTNATFPAKNALDGSLSTKWATSANQANGQTFVVDLGAAQTFSQLTLDAGGATEFPHGYQVHVSNDGTTWGTAVATGTGTTQSLTISFAAQTARYVSVTQTATFAGIWSVAELNVFGTTAVRTLWTATASSTGGTDVAANALDNKTTTRWNTAAAQANGQTFTVDMVVPKRFNRLTLDAGNGNGSSNGNSPRAYQVNVSNDGTTWGSPIATGTGTGQLVTINFLTQTARYVRVTQTGTATNTWSIVEFNVWRGLQTCDTATCTALDVCHDVGTCDPNTGACTNPNKTNGTACPNGTVCDGGETCQAGVCTAGTPPVVDDSNPCTVDACNAVTGVSHTPGNAGTACRTAVNTCDVGETCTGTSATCPTDQKQPNGTACPNATVCDGAETCQAGVCTPGTPPVVDDGNPCTVDACNAVGGVSHTPGNAGVTCRGATGTCDAAETCTGTSTACPIDQKQPNGTPCPNGTVCDGAETCQGGVCTPGVVPVVDDGNPCTVDACNPASGVSHAPGNAGTTCRPAVNACDVAEACSGTTGTCPADQKQPNGTTCNDGDACTQTDSCQAGTCVGSNSKTCPVPDQCHTAGTCVPATGACTNPQKSNGTTCDDANACTQNDACQGGNCTGGATVTCAAPDQCHQPGTCSPTGWYPPVSQEGLVGWWRFEGDLHDWSGNGHDLTNSGAQPIAGRVGQAYSFDGTACLTANGAGLDLSGAPGISMMAWVKTGTQFTCPSTRVVIGKGFNYALATQCGTWPDIDYGPDVTGTVSTVGHPNGWPGGIGLVPRTDWSLVAVTFDQHHLRYYLNGQPLGSDVDEGIPADFAVWPTFTIGCQQNGGLGSFYIGSIDEVSLYRRTLTDADIAGYYAASTTPSNDPCIAFPKNNGTTCNDDNACSISDSCQAGSCTGASQVVCALPDQCHTPGTCNPASGVCSNPLRTNGASCSDGDACTDADTCQLGACAPGVPATCSGDQCSQGTCNSSWVPTPASNALAGWWRLEGDGTDSGPEHIDVPMARAYPVGGKVGRGMQFDGNTCMYVPAPASLATDGSSGFTMMAWVKVADDFVCHPDNADEIVFGKGDDYNISIGCSNNDPIMGAILHPSTSTGYGFFHAFRPLLRGTWHHLAATLGGGNIYLYVDGEYGGSYVVGDGFTLSDFDHYFGIGCNTSSVYWVGTSFHGAVDEIVVEKRTLSASEIADFYATSSGPGGRCVATPKPDGTTCDDGSACTHGDVCQAGTCSGTNAVVCATPDDCHDRGACNPATGVCAAPTERPNGSACGGDGNPCTAGDACLSGVCTGMAVSCPVADQCHQGSGACSPTAGASPPQNGLVGWWRFDGDLSDSSGNGFTLAGAGSQTEPGKFGSAVRLDGTTCLQLPNTPSAFDLSGAAGVTMMAWVKTSPDRVCPSPPIVQGVMGKGLDYDLVSACWGGSSPGLTQGFRTQNGQDTFPGYWGTQPTGTWTHVAVTFDHHTIQEYLDGVPGGFRLLDGNVSNADSTFSIGCLLYGGLPPTAQYQGAIDEATLYNRVLSPAEIAAYFQAANGNPCSYSNAPNGTSCSDGNTCTGGDVCQTGACVGTAPMSCPAPGPCQVAAANSCDPTTGCPSFVAAPDGTTCNDGNACTQTDACHAGACAGANPVTCAAADPCHGAGACDPQTGVCSSPFAPGAACQVGVFDYDKAGRLIRDHATTLKYDAYDQLVEVTPGPQGPMGQVPFANLPIDSLGQLPGGNFSNAVDVNLAGTIVGYGTVNGTADNDAFLYSGAGPMVDIAPVGSAQSINEQGVVVGSYKAPDGNYDAFTYTVAGGLVDLGRIGDTTYGGHANVKGQVSGRFMLNGLGHAYLYTPGGSFAELEGLGGANTYSWNLNDDGDVIGSAQKIDSPDDIFDIRHLGHGVIWHHLLGLQEVDTLVDQVTSPGWEISSAFCMAGDYIFGTGVHNGATRAFRLKTSTGEVLELSTPQTDRSYANACTSRGDAAGALYDAQGQHGWVYVEGRGMFLIRDIIDPSGAWDLRQVNGMNDAGDVVGFGVFHGLFTGYRVRLPLQTAGASGPLLAETHTYGYDGLRTSTTTGTDLLHMPSSQYWFTQDYTETTAGNREHYVRIGDRIVAKVTMTPAPGGGFVPPVTQKLEKRGDNGSGGPQLGLAALLLALALAGGALGLLSKRRGWVPATASVVALILTVTSCGMLGGDRLKAALWHLGTDAAAPLYFHQGISPGPTIITTSTGAVFEERRYEPFGQPVDAKKGPGAVGAVNFAAEPQNILGKLTDPNTGWSYHGARWMAPQTGRWSTPDPATKGPEPKHMLQPWDLNPYSYGRQSPPLYWDPNGAEVNLAVFGRPGDRLYDIASDMLDHNEYPSVTAVMEREKSYEQKEELPPRDRSVDRMTMDDGFARGIEVAEREVMIQIAFGKVFEAVGAGMSRLFFGAVATIRDIRRARALEFFIDHGVRAEDALAMVRGIRLSSSVTVTTLKAGTELIQYSKPGQVGRWFAKAGTPLEKLGIAPNGRGAVYFKLTRDVKVLRSTAEDILDTWTVRNGKNYVGIVTKGGAEQYYVPDKAAAETLDHL